MKKEAFTSKMGEEWAMKFQKFIESPAMDSIYATLREKSKKGDIIYPISEDTFRAFKSVHPDNVKLIVFGADPYPSTFYDNKKPQADGLCLSNSYSTGKMQPSLITFLEGLAKYFNLPYESYFKIIDLSYLTEQGVLLLNSSLTVTKNQIGSHQDLWFPFFKFFFEEIMREIPNVPVIFLGSESAKLKKFLFPMTHPFFELKHPSFYARTGQEMEFDGVLDKIDNYLREHKSVAIKWSYKVWEENKENPLISTHSLPF